jgi:hypothetical protein
LHCITISDIYLVSYESGGAKKMNLQEEIAKVAYELYEKSGCIKGRESENWLEAERIVLLRHASQDIEEPEGESRIIAEEGLIEEVEETAPMYAGRQKEEYRTDVDERAVQRPAVKTEKSKAVKKSVPKGKKMSPKKTGGKSREKYL